MNNAFFDTLAYAKDLMKFGFTRQQAEGQATAMAKFMGPKIATKNDIKRLEKELVVLTQKLTIRLGSMLVVGLSVLATLITILK